MNKFLSFSLALLLAGTAVQAQRSDCGVNPQANTIQQADGSSITLHPFGTESVNYLETNAGYTVLYNKASGNYEYARQDAHGNLELSGITANDKADQSLGKNGMPTHLRYSAQQVNMLRQYFAEETRIEKEYGKAGPNVFPPNGDRKVLVLMVEYPDLLATIPTSNFEMLLNQDNYASGSYRDYYKSATKGRLRLTCDVYGWYMADSGYKYYGKTSSPSYGTATRRLLLGAINDADSAGLDFAQYDSDSDGYVDAVILIHAGWGAEESSAPNSGNYIWSFRSTLSSGTTPTKDGKKFSAYCMFPEKLYNGGSPIIVGIGVIAHEFGHILDLPDLYSTSYNNSGAGNYTIMAAGTWLNYQKTPSYFDAWSKQALGWTTVQTITEVGNYTIPYSVADSNFAFRINTKRSNEYFLLENRQIKGFDKFLPSKGLAVWHINTNYAGRLTQLPNNTNNDTSSLGVQLLQADGLRELERNINNGNSGDLFPGTGGTKKNITPFTTPSTNFHVTYEPSNIYITNITQNPDSSISFKFSSQPAAAFDVNRLTGCAPLTVDFSNNSTAAFAFKWKFSNGKVDSTHLNTTMVFDSSGAYDVTLVVYDSLGTPSDSISSTIQVFPTPKASHTASQIGNKLTLTSTSTGASFIQWQYSIGSTSFTSSANPLADVNVPDTGLFKYKLIAINNYSCADTSYGSTRAYPTAVKEEVKALESVNVYPNPFTGELKVAFQLDQTTPVSFELYNLIGEKVASLAERFYTAGNQTVSLDQLVSAKAGVYLLQINTPSSRKTIRLIKAVE